MTNSTSRPYVGMYPRKSSLAHALVIGLAASVGMLASSSYALMIALGVAHSDAPQVPALGYWASLALTWGLSAAVSLGGYATSARK